jgi:hypothetical protein
MNGGKCAPVRRRGEVYELVRTAVVEKRPVSAVYHGYPRLLCPHRLGWNSRGQARVLCYQYGGESESGLKLIGSPANWRCIDVDDLHHVKLLEEDWRTAPNYARPQTCVTEVDVDVEDQPDRDPQKGQ